jgi:hypothetical protein
MGNTIYTPIKNTTTFLIERTISNEITIGICNKQKQGLRYDNVMYYFKNLIELKDKLIYQFENSETDQVFLIIERNDNKISYILEINNKKHIGNILDLLKTDGKKINFQSKEIDKIFDFIK